jgi:hypothetical protein
VELDMVIIGTSTNDQQGQKIAYMQQQRNAQAIQFATFSARGVSGQGLSPEAYNQAKADAFTKGLIASGVDPFSHPSHAAAAASLGIDFSGMTPGRVVSGPSPSGGSNKFVTLSENVKINAQDDREAQQAAQGYQSNQQRIQDARQAAIEEARNARPLLTKNEVVSPRDTGYGTPKGYADFFGVTPTGITKPQGKSVSQSALDLEVNKALKGRTPGEVSGAERSIFGDVVGQKARPSPSGKGFVYSNQPEEQANYSLGSLVTSNSKNPTVAGVPLFSGATKSNEGVFGSNVPLSSANIAEFSKTNPDFASSLNSGISQAGSKGASVMVVDFGGGDVRTYPINAQTKQVILNDVADNFAKNPTQAGNISLSAAYSYIQPRTEQQKASDRAQVDKLSSDIQNMKDKGADTFILYANGNKVSETYGDRVFHDAIAIRKEYGNVQVQGTNQAAIQESKNTLADYLSGTGNANGVYVSIYDQSGNKVGQAPIKYAQQEASMASSIFGPVTVKAVNPSLIAQNRQQALSNVASIKSAIAQAQAAGVDSVDIVDQNGKVIKSVSPDNAFRSLIAASKGGNAVGLRYSSTSANLTRTQQQELASGHISLATYADFVDAGKIKPKTDAEKAEYLASVAIRSGAQLPEQTYNLFEGFINPSAKKNPTFAPSETFYDKMFSFVPAGAKAAGIGKDTRSPSDIFFGGLEEAKKEAESNPLKVVAETPGFVSQWIGFGLAAKGGTMALSKGIDLANTYGGSLFLGTASKIGKGLREGQAEYQVSKPSGSVFAEFSQGTASKSGIDKMNPKIGGPDFVINRFGILKPTRSLSEAELPNPKGEVQAKIPQATIGSDLTNLFKSTPSKGDYENFLIRGDLSPAEQTRLGVKKASYGLGLFFGEATPETKIALKQAQDAGKLSSPIQDIITYPTKEVAKEPKKFAFFGQNPEVVESRSFSSAEFTRPTTTRFFETSNLGLGRERGFVGGAKNQGGTKVGSLGMNRYLTDIGLSPALEPKRISYKGTGDFFFGKSDEASGGVKPKPITKEESRVFSSFTTETPAKAEPKTDYLGLGAVSRFANQKQQQSSSWDYIYTPTPKSGSKVTSESKSKETNIFGNVVIPKSETEIKTSIDILPKLATDRTQTQREQTDLFFGTTPRTDQGTKTTPSQSYFTLEETKTDQGTKYQSALSYLTGLQETGKTTETGMFQEKIPYKGESIFGPGGGLPFVPFGGSAGPSGGGKRNKKSYLLFGTNPFEVGEFETKGLPTLTVSASPSIFLAGEKVIRRANKGRTGFASYSPLSLPSKSRGKTQSLGNKRQRTTSPRKSKGSLWF